MRVPPIWVGLLMAAGCVGCRSRTTALVGTWQFPDFSGISFRRDNTFTWYQGQLGNLQGTWKFDGDDVVMSPVSFRGQPISQIKSSLAPQVDSMPASWKQWYDDLDKPNYFKVSADGKMLLTDPVRDPNGNPTLNASKKQDEP